MADDWIDVRMHRAYNLQDSKLPPREKHRRGNAMSNRKAITITAWVVLLITNIWLVIGIKTMSPCDKDHVLPVTSGGTVYEIEQRDDGSMNVSTDPQYIKQLSDHTVVITDLSKSEVGREMVKKEGWK